MNRRQFLLGAGATGLAYAAPDTTSATILYADRSIPLSAVRTEGGELWVRASDLPKINEFELKPEGACRASVCVPLSRGMRKGDWFHLTAFARKLGQSWITEPSVWSFSEIPLLRGTFYSTRMAPDFGVTDRKGRIVHLSDFRGRKTLIVTWASW